MLIDTGWFWPPAASQDTVISADLWLVIPGRYFLDQVAGWILELDRGKGIPFEGNYSAWLDAKNKRLSSESKSQVSFTWCTRLLVNKQPCCLQ